MVSKKHLEQGIRCCSLNEECTLLATGDVREKSPAFEETLPSTSCATARCLAFGRLSDSICRSPAVIAEGTAGCERDAEGEAHAEEPVELVGDVERASHGKESLCLVGGFDDGSICVWKKQEEWSLVQHLQRAHSGIVRSILFLRCGEDASQPSNRFVTASDNGTVRAWALQALKGCEAAEQELSSVLESTQEVCIQREDAASVGAEVMSMHLWEERAQSPRSARRRSSACDGWAPAFCTCSKDGKVTAWRRSSTEPFAWGEGESWRFGLASNLKGFMQVVVGDEETVVLLHGCSVSVWSRRGASEPPQSEAGQEVVPSAYERMGRDTGRLERAQLTERGWTMENLGDATLERIRAGSMNEDGDMLAVVDWTGNVVFWERARGRDGKGRLSSEGGGRWSRVHAERTGEDCWALMFGRGSSASILFVCGGTGKVEGIDVSRWRTPPVPTRPGKDVSTSIVQVKEECTHTKTGNSHVNDHAIENGEDQKKTTPTSVDSPRENEGDAEGRADENHDSGETKHSDEGGSDPEVRSNGFVRIRSFQRRFQRGQGLMRGALGRRLLDRVEQQQTQEEFPNVPLVPFKRGPGRPPKYGTARWKELYLATRGGMAAAATHGRGGVGAASPRPAPTPPARTASSSEGKESPRTVAQSKKTVAEDAAQEDDGGNSPVASTVHDVPKFEALASDGAWYDVTLVEQRADGMIRTKMVNCNQRGYEWLEPRLIRRRSDVFSAGQIPRVGDHVLAYQQRQQHDLYYDAEVITVKEKQSVSEKNVLVQYLHGPEQGCNEWLALGSLLKVHTEPVALYTLRKSILSKSGGLMPRHSSRQGEATRVGGKFRRVQRDASHSAGEEASVTMDTPRSEADPTAARLERQRRRRHAADLGEAGEGRGEEAGGSSRSQSPLASARNGTEEAGDEERTDGVGAAFGGYGSRAGLRSAMRTILLRWKSASDSEVKQFKELLHAAHPELSPTARVISETNLIIDGTGDVLHKVVVDRDGMPGIRDCTLPERAATLKLVGGSSLAASAEPELQKGSTQYGRWHLPLSMEDVRKIPSFLRSHADVKRTARVAWQSEEKSGDESEQEAALPTAYGAWLQSELESKQRSEELDAMGSVQRTRSLSHKWAALSKEQLKSFQSTASAAKKDLKVADTWQSSVEDVGSASQDQWLRLRALGIGKRKPELEFTFVPSSFSSKTAHTWWPPMVDPLLNRSLPQSTELPLHAMPRKLETEPTAGRKEGEGDGTSRMLQYNRFGLACGYSPEIDGLPVHCHPTGVNDHRTFHGRLVQDVATGKITVSTKEWGKQSLSTWLENVGNHNRRAFINVFLTGSDPTVNLKTYLSKFTVADPQTVDGEKSAGSRRAGDAKKDSQSDLGLWRLTGSSYLGREIRRTVVAESSDSDGADSSHSEDEVITAKIIAWITAAESDFTSDATGKPAALWKCVHTDGDFEDLEESEVKEGLEAAGFPVEPHRPTSGVRLEPVPSGTDPIVAILHQAVVYLGGFEEVSLKRKWKKLARGLEVRNSSHLKQKYYDWSSMESQQAPPAASAEDPTMTAQHRPRGLAVLRLLVAKRAQDKVNSAEHIQDKRETRPRAMIDVAEAAARLVDSLRSNAFISKAGLSSNLLRARFKQLLRRADVAEFGRLLEKLESNLNWGAMTLDFDGIRDDLLTSLENLNSVADAYLAVQAINYCIKETFRRRSMTKADENGSASESGDGRAESVAGSEGPLREISGRFARRRPLPAPPPPTAAPPPPAAPPSRSRKRRRPADALSLPSKHRSRTVSSSQAFVRGPDGRFSKVQKPQSEEKNDAQSVNADGADGEDDEERTDDEQGEVQCGEEHSDEPTDVREKARANSGAEKGMRLREAQTSKRRRVVKIEKEDDEQTAPESTVQANCELSSLNGRHDPPSSVSRAHKRKGGKDMDRPSEHRPAKRQREQEVRPQSQWPGQRGGGETERERRERMVAAALSTHRRREEQSKSSISQAEIRKLLDGLSFERDKKEDKKKRSHKKQWKPEELVGRDIKVWSFQRDQRGGERYAWRMATVRELRDETRRILHQVEWHDNKKQEWRNLEREKYRVPEVKLAKACPAGAASVPAPALDTRRTRRRPRAVKKATPRPAPLRSTQDLDATERYLARARDWSCLTATRDGSGPASSSPRANASPRAMLGGGLELKTQRERRLSSCSSAKSQPSSASRAEKDGADLEAVACQRPTTESRSNAMFQLTAKTPQGWHMDCLDKPLKTLPHGSWFCPKCLASRADGDSTASAAPKALRHPPSIQTGTGSRRPSQSGTSSPLTRSSPRAGGAFSPQLPPQPGSTGRRLLLSPANASAGASLLPSPSRRPPHLSSKPPTPKVFNSRSGEPSPSSAKSSPMSTPSRRMSASGAR